jgi:hypothetical protein
MKNKKLIIVSLVSLGLAYYFGMKKGDKDATTRIMKRAVYESNLPQ